MCSKSSRVCRQSTLPRRSALAPLHARKERLDLLENRVGIGRADDDGPRPSEEDHAPLEIRREETIAAQPPTPKSAGEGVEAAVSKNSDRPSNHLEILPGPSESLELDGR